MELKVLIAGKGGEGIIFMTRILAEGAFSLGIPVISSEIHGMAQRGGSVISQVKLGKFYSPFIPYGKADFLIATSKEEGERNQIYLKPDGILVVNSPESLPFHINASSLAQKLDHPKGANLILLGFAINKMGLKEGPFLEAIDKHSPSSVREKNKKAFLCGFFISKEENIKPLE